MGYSKDDGFPLEIRGGVCSGSDTIVGEGLVVFAGQRKPGAPWCSSRSVLLTYLYEGGEQEVS